MDIISVGLKQRGGKTTQPALEVLTLMTLKQSPVGGLASFIDKAQHIRDQFPKDGINCGSLDNDSA